MRWQRAEVQGSLCIDHIVGEEVMGEDGGVMAAGNICGDGRGLPRNV